MAPLRGLPNRDNHCYIIAAIAALASSHTARSKLATTARSSPFLLHKETARCLVSLLCYMHTLSEECPPLQPLAVSAQSVGGCADAILCRWVSELLPPSAWAMVDAHPPSCNPLLSAASDVYLQGDRRVLPPSVPSPPLLVVRVHDPLREFQDSAALQQRMVPLWECWSMRDTMVLPRGRCGEYICVGLVCIQRVRLQVTDAVLTGMNHYVALVRPSFESARHVPETWRSHVSCVGWRCGEGLGVDGGAGICAGADEGARQGGGADEGDGGEGAGARKGEGARTREGADNGFGKGSNLEDEDEEGMVCADHWWLVNDNEVQDTGRSTVDNDMVTHFGGNGRSLAQHVVAMVFVLRRSATKRSRPT
jgi:hypothetical protein